MPSYQGGTNKQYWNHGSQELLLTNAQGLLSNLVAYIDTFFLAHWLATIGVSYNEKFWFLIFESSIGIFSIHNLVLKFSFN